MSHTTRLENIPVAGTRSYPPRHSNFTAVFWQGLKQGIWQTTRCGACGHATFPPKPVCPHCWSADMSWAPLGSRGHLYSWTRIHAAPAIFATESPYAVGIVDLDEGLRLACRLLENENTIWTPGMPVEMVVLSYEDGPLFAARPI
ncbi:MAG: DNA-binding protein [Betaproteobacteria bacterium HGW-Betaproteobacteria-16]|nr:MAG: DNA-binding protein [Betaproteobacteria bacterium HGW-Betaproteobacteria-16]